MLVCATETKSSADIQHYVENISRIVDKLPAAKHSAQPKTA